MSVLLVYPPFGSTTNLSLALPILAAHLRSNSIEARVLDANLAFLRSILTEKGITEGYRLTQDRFLELNARDLASLQERQDYYSTATLLQQASRFVGRWDDALFTPNQEIKKLPQAIERIQALTAALSLVQTPYPDAVSISDTAGSGQINQDISHTPQKLSSRFLLDQTVNDGEGSIFAGFFSALLTPILAEQRYTILGISVSFKSQIQAALLLARAAKGIDPRIHVVLGGGFISTVLRDPPPTSDVLFEVIDSMVIDEGEIPLVRLHEELTSPHPDLSRVPALVYQAEGRTVKNEPVAPPALEGQPFPDYSDYDLDSYLVPRPWMEVGLRSSRGCSWRRCSFCRVNARFMSNRDLAPAAYVYESLRAVLDQTGARRIGFADPEADIDILAELCQMLVDSKTRVYWAANVRCLPQLTIQKCFLMLKAGCVGINFGIESYNDRILKLNRKGLSTGTIDRGLSNVSWAGIRSLTYMIAGLPGETLEDAIDGFSAIHSKKRNGLIHKYLYSAFDLQKGTHIYNNLESYGIREVRFPEGEDLADSAEHFAGDVMPLGIAQVLAALFNHMQQADADATWEKTVSINDREIEVRHDLHDLVMGPLQSIRERVDQRLLEIESGRT